MISGRRGGLSILPSRDVGCAVGGDGWWVESAAVGGWAAVLIDPESDLVEVLGGGELADVLDGGDGFARGVVDGLAAGVDAGEES